MVIARRRLLIADDDAALRETLCEALEDHFDVVPAEDGEHAIECLDREPADAAVFDVQMGEVSGLDVLETARRRELVLPTLFMTARPTDEVLRRAAVLGGSPVLTKPFPLLSLIESLCEVLTRAYGREAVPAGLSPDRN